MSIIKALKDHSYMFRSLNDHPQARFVDCFDCFPFRKTVNTPRHISRIRVLSITSSTKCLIYIRPFFWEIMNVCVILWIFCVRLCYSLTFYITLQVFVLLFVCLFYSLNVYVVFWLFVLLSECSVILWVFTLLSFCCSLNVSFSLWAFVLLSDTLFYSLSVCVIL
jgi:hypothetical protein